MTDRDYSDPDRLEDLEAAVRALEEKCERYAKALQRIAEAGRPSHGKSAASLRHIALDALWPRASGDTSWTELDDAA